VGLIELAAIDMNYFFNKNIVFVFSGAFFLIYALLITYLTGNIGFEGDDWWIFSWPYWNSFPMSLWLYSKELLRPLEGVYWISLFELFGFNKIVFHFLSICLLAGASLLMGACLYNMYPERKAFVTASIFWAFFLPTVSCLTFVVTTDNSRLSLLIFWASVLSFQRWVKKDLSWMGLILPVLLYVAAFFTYEAASFLIFTMPLFVIPLYGHRSQDALRANFLVKMACGTLSAFSIALLIRFLVLKGGAVSHSDLLPSFELIASYFALLPWYLFGVFDFSYMDWTSIALGLAVCIFLCVFLLYLEKKRLEFPEDSVQPYYKKKFYIILMSVMIILLGVAPYLFAGYGSVAPKIADTVWAKYGFIPSGYTAWYNYNWSSRIYSSASFGMAILLAFFMTHYKDYKKRVSATIAGVVFLGFAVAFHVGLVTDWKEAAQIRNSLCKSLISQVPDVEPKTNFLFVDLESYHKRAAIFRGWNGLRELMKMLYYSRDLGAYYVYKRSLIAPNELHQQAVYYPKGFVSRGVKIDKPLSPDSLVVLDRTGSDLVLLDSLSRDDGLVSNGIKWVGVSSFTSNIDRILPWSTLPQGPVQNAWSSGLIATLNLYQLNLSYKMPHQWIYTGFFKQKQLTGFK
jgi:hypothetical protein